MEFAGKQFFLKRSRQSEATDESVNDYALQILDAVFAVKSPGTLLKRLYAIQSFHEWCSDKAQQVWIPIAEQLAWQYAKWLQSTHAPPTKVEALRFCWFVPWC